MRQLNTLEVAGPLIERLVHSLGGWTGNMGDRVGLRNKEGSELMVVVCVVSRMKPSTIPEP